MQSNRSSLEKTKALVGMAIFTAIVVVLQVIATALGRMGLTPPSLVLIPIVIGSAVYGLKTGAWLGLVFGIVVLLLPMGMAATVAGLLLLGLGCAPIYPCVIHSTPDYFGAENSQAVIGVQMASAYVGICLMPPLFGLIANHISVSLLPVYLAVILVLMVAMHELLIKRCPVKMR